jgi:hypothetical protein
LQGPTPVTPDGFFFRFAQNPQAPVQQREQRRGLFTQGVSPQLVKVSRFHHDGQAPPVEQQTHHRRAREEGKQRHAEEHLLPCGGGFGAGDRHAGGGDRPRSGFQQRHV